MGFKEKFLGINSAIWFQTAGVTLNTYLHPAVKSFDSVKSLKGIKGDIYDKIIPQTKQTDKRIDVKKIRQEGREDFYKGLKKEMDINFAIFVGANRPEKSVIPEFHKTFLNSQILNLRIVDVC